MIKKSLALSIAIALNTGNVFAEDIYSKIDANQPSIKAVSTANQNQLLLAAGVFDPLFQVLDFQKSNIKTIESVSYTHLTLPTTPYV